MCQRAKVECEKIAMKRPEAWIAGRKQVVASTCDFNVGILILVLLPTGSRLRLNTIKT
jgi:hypothetical protein